MFKGFKMKLVDVNGIRKLIAEMGFPEFFQKLVAYIREDLQHWSEFSKKERVSFYLKEGIIELMPIAGPDYFANKFVCTHPHNHRQSKYGVMGQGLWVDAHSGEPLMLTEMTFLTALRTAALSVLVSLEMAPRPVCRMAIIGCGAQSHFQILAHHIFFNAQEIECYDVNPEAMKRLIDEMAMFGIHLKASQSIIQTVQNSDILITATNALRIHPVLQASMLHPHLHINAIGGDAPGYSECDPNILHQVDRIVVEYLPQTRIEGEIQQIPFHMIEDKTFELHQIVNKQQIGRLRSEEITLFDGVGFALFDYSTLRLLDDLTQDYSFAQEVNIIPVYDKNKSLFCQLIDGKP